MAGEVPFLVAYQLTRACAVDALRALLAGGPAARPVLLTVAWIAGLVVVFAPLAIRRYRREWGQGQ